MLAHLMTWYTGHVTKLIQREVREDQTCSPMALSLELIVASRLRWPPQLGQRRGQDKRDSRWISLYRDYRWALGPPERAAYIPYQERIGR